MRVDGGSSSGISSTPAASNDPPQSLVDAWTQARAAASNKPSKLGSDQVAPPTESAEQAALGTAIGTLGHNDSATLGMTAGGQWSIASLGAQAQAQDGASITVTNVGTASKPQYQVTLTETQQAGMSATSAGGEDPEPSASDAPSAQKHTKGVMGGVVAGPGCATDQPSSKPTPKIGIGGVVPVPVYDPVSGGEFNVGMPRINIFGQTKPSQREGGSRDSGCQTEDTTSGQEQANSGVSAQSNSSMSYTVTVTLKNKYEAVAAANTFAAMAATTSKPGNLVDNPIMDEINGKSTRTGGVSPSDLGLLKDNLTSYGETLTASAAVVGSTPLFAKTNFGQLNVNVNNTVSLSRTVTLASGGQPANVAYTLADQTSTAPTIGFPVGSDQASEQGQVSYTQQYNLSKNEVTNPEASLGGRWLTPDVVQETFQTQTQLGPTVNLPHGSSAGGSLVQTTTTTATYINPRPTALNSARQAFRSDRTHPASSKPQAPGSNLSWKQTTTDNSSITVGSWPISATLTTSRFVPSLSSQQ